jgi:hypothetical protein
MFDAVDLMIEFAKDVEDKRTNYERLTDRPAAFRLVLSAFCFPASAFCFPPSAFCFLHSAFRLLLSAFCFLPSAFLLPSHHGI